MTRHEASFPTGVAAACVAAAVAVVVAGCTVAAGAVSGADRVEAGRAITDAEQLVVDEARELLIEECMADEGFRYWPVPVGSVEERQGSGYVLDDVGWAREHGYGTDLEDRIAALQQNDPTMRTPTRCRRRSACATRRSWTATRPWVS